MSAGARRLDLMLCEDIISINSRLASLEEWDRAFIKNAFARLALVRPKSAQLLTHATEALRDDQVETERILLRAYVESKLAKEDIVAVR